MSANCNLFCEKCLIAHDGKYGSGRFCSSACARSFSSQKTPEVCRKISETLKNKVRPPPVLLEKECVNCKVKFQVRLKYKNQIYCSLVCKNKVTSVLGGKASAAKTVLRSKNEIYFADLCKQKFQNVVTNVAMFDGWDADVILLDEKIAVHWNGKWHYEKIKKNHSLLQVQTRDKIKLDVIKKHGYESYVIKDMGKANPTFVEEQFCEFLVWLKNKTITPNS